MNCPPTVPETLHADILNGIPVGVIVCRPSGAVVSQNAASRRLMKQDDGLRAVGWLSSPDELVQDQLSSALADAANGAGCALVVERPSGRLGYQLRFVPLYSARMVVVFLTDPTDTPRPPRDSLVEAYGMTPSEAEIAVELAGGADLRQVAAVRGVHIDTCRKQLRSIFDKVGVRRQVDLTRVLSGGAIAFGPPEPT